MEIKVASFNGFLLLFFIGADHLSRASIRKSLRRFHSWNGFVLGRGLRIDF